MQQKREGEGNFDFKFIDLDYILLKRGEAMGEGGGIELVGCILPLLQAQANGTGKANPEA